MVAQIEKSWEARLEWEETGETFFAETAGKARYAAYKKWKPFYCSLGFKHIRVKRALEQAGEGERA